jgi:uncharacterized membrane protein
MLQKIIMTILGFIMLLFLFVVITIPRDILWRKIKAKMSSYSVHKEKLK